MAWVIKGKVRLRRDFLQVILMIRVCNAACGSYVALVEWFVFKCFVVSFENSFRFVIT